MMKTTNERMSERANERKKNGKQQLSDIVIGVSNAFQRDNPCTGWLAGWLTVATHTHIHAHISISISVCSSSVCKNSLSFQFNKFINFSIDTRHTQFLANGRDSFHHEIYTERQHLTISYDVIL